MQPAPAIGKPSHPCTFVAPNSARPALASTRVSWVRSFIHSWRGLCPDIMALWLVTIYLTIRFWGLLVSLKFKFARSWIAHDFLTIWWCNRIQQSEDVFDCCQKAWTVALACSIADLLRKPVAIVVDSSGRRFFEEKPRKNVKKRPRLRPFWSLWCRRATTNGLTRWSTSL